MPMMNHPFWKALSLYLAAAVIVLSLPAQGWAMLVPAENAEVRSADLQRVQAVLESGAIRQRLMDYGLSSEEAVARINSLSDEQVHQLAANLDAVQAGGDVLSDVIVILLIVVLVIVILELTGHRVVMKR
jgi:Family of unknown function (DUF6627)